MSIYIYEKSGKSKSENKKEILEDLGIPEKNLKFESSSLKKGFLPFVGGGLVNTRVFLKNDEVAHEAIAAAVALNLIHKMGYDAKVEDKSVVEGKSYIKFSTSSLGVLIGKKGRTLESIQFITDLIVGNISGVKRRTIIDIEDYRERRKLALERLARHVADKVIEANSFRFLRLMNPFERRIVHLILQEDMRIYTLSEGTGILKRIKIGILPEGVNKKEHVEKLAAELQANPPERHSNYSRNNSRGGQRGGSRNKSRNNSRNNSRNKQDENYNSNSNYNSYQKNGNKTENTEYPKDENFGNTKVVPEINPEEENFNR